MLEGIFTGLGTAFFQSLCYLSTRHYVQRRTASAGPQLLVLAHAIMGIFALALLAFFWPHGPLAWNQTLRHLLFNTFFYTGGQIALVVALQHAEASRVSPLMTFKLIISSILVMLYGQPVGGAAAFLTPLQWLAVGICLIAAVSINYSGGRMKSRAILAIVLGSMSFSLSDWNINLMIRDILSTPGMDQFHGSILAGLLSYLATGALALALLPLLGSRRSRDWIEAIPFSLAWFASMICLYTAFASVGILLGSILQCTRGFITIVLAFIIMHRGHHHIEPHAPRGIILRRLAAGVLMFIGISLYVLRDPAHLKIHPPPPPAPHGNRS